MRRNYQTLANNMPLKTSADEKPVSLEHSVNERQQADNRTSDELDCRKLAVCMFQAHHLFPVMQITETDHKTKSLTIAHSEFLLFPQRKLMTAA